MKVLITGGAGFIGSHLAEALLESGHHVYVVDDLSTGSIDNIAHLKTQPRFHYTIDTVFNDSLVAELVDRAEVIFHLAAAVGVKLIVQEPVHTIETNVHGTEVILRHAVKTGQYGMVVPTFVRQALADEPITVFGDGTQSRSFTYVGDVVGALLKLMVEPRAIGQVFNLGNREEVTIRELAERIRKLTGSRSPIHVVPYDEAYEAGFEDMPRRVPDLTKIHRLIGYEPKVGLDEIIERVVADFRERANVSTR
jgi:nucleoside-diphosphate-sugar epimerase